MAEDTGATDTAESVQAGAEVPEPTPRTEVANSGELTGLTQADVVRVVESRLARERKKFEGFDEYKEKAQAYDEAVWANQSELEKAQTLAAELAAENEELADAAAYVSTRSTLLQEVAKPERKIVDPEGAIEFLLGVDQDLFEVDEDGLPTNIPEAVDALVEKRSYLTGTIVPRSNADQGARGGGGEQLTQSDLQKMTPQEIVQAQEEGKLNTLLGG